MAVSCNFHTVMVLDASAGVPNLAYEATALLAENSNILKPVTVR